MRELKFRAWDGLYKEMSYSWQYPELYEFFKYALAARYLRIQQYTGLADKNNKPIYEGDIVAIKENPHEVYWCEMSAQFRFAAFGDRQYDKTKMPIFAKVSAVIGNIHENPELLENNG